VAWIGTRVYVGARWSVLAAADGSFTWTEIRVANPFPTTVALAVSFRDVTGAPDTRFFSALTLPGMAQAFFLVRLTPVPSSASGWFTLTSSPTPVVPCADIYWAQPGVRTEVFGVPIEQLDADGFPIGDAAAQPRPPAPPPAPAPIQSLRHPPVTDLWAEGAFGDEHAAAALELFKTAQAGPGSLDAAAPYTHTVGLLVDDEAEEFRSRFDELRRS
jgi:hypothetical protein